MRYLFLLLIVAFASCEKPQDEMFEPDYGMTQEPANIVEPTVTATTTTATETTATATETAVEPTQTATSTQATETQANSNGWSSWINSNAQVEGDGIIDVIIPDGQGFGSDEHGARMILNAKNETNNATYHKLLGSIAEGVKRATEIDSDYTQIVASATDNNGLMNGHVDVDIERAIDLLSEDLLYIDALENTTQNYNPSSNSTTWYTDAEVYGLHGDAAHLISERGTGIDFTIFVGGVKRASSDNKLYLSVAKNFLSDFDGHVIYVETTAGDSSMGTGRLAGIAAEFAAEGLSASEIKAEIFALGEMTTVLEAGLMTNGQTQYNEIEVLVIKL